MNAFDLVVTVALGSTLATVLLNKDVALAEGALAFALLIGLQFIVTWSSVRVRWVRALATGEPQMLLLRGKILSAALQHARVTEDEVRAAVGLQDCMIWKLQKRWYWKRMDHLVSCREIPGSFLPPASWG